MLKNVNMQSAVLSGGATSVSQRGVNLSGAVLDGVNMQYSKAFDVNLSNASLIKTDLTNVKFVDASLNNAVIKECVCAEVNFLRSSAQDARFIDSAFQNTALHRAILNGADIRGCKFDACTSLDELTEAGATIEGASAATVAKDQSKEMSR
jgi:uncharacterized protein YjbI with pentapeptide repeats